MINFNLSTHLLLQGQFLADQYQETCKTSGAGFVQAKYDKKISNAQKSSFVVALLCDDSSSKNPLVEEICSVAMAVQNMLLVATAHKVGAYWSTGCVHDKKAAQQTNSLVLNPASTRDFLNLDDSKICLGWIFVGDFYGDDENSTAKKWPEGRRKDLQQGRLSWR
jgi:hypothetical protein